MEYTCSEYAEFATELIQKYLFECNMTMLNVDYAPAMTSGQEYHFMKHISFHETIIDLAKNFMSHMILGKIKYVRIYFHFIYYCIYYRWFLLLL